MMKDLQQDYRYIKIIIANVSEWKGKYITGLILKAVTDYLNVLLIGLIMGGMIKYAQLGQYSSVLREALKWSVLIVLCLAVGSMGSYIFKEASLNASSRLKRRLFSHMVNLPYSITSKVHTGDNLSRLDSDASLCSNILERLLSSILGSAVSLVLGIITVSAISLEITLALIGVGILMMIINLLLIDKSKVRWKATQQQRGETVSYMSDILAGSQLIRIYGEDTGLLERFTKSCKNLFAKAMSALNLSAAYYGLNQVNAGLTTACSIGLGLVLYSKGSIDIAVLPILIQVGAAIVSPISGIGWIIMDLQESLAGARRVSEVLDQPEEGTAVQSSHLKLQHSKIIANGLSFSYDDGKETLKDVYFMVSSGETCGIAGYSGSGKSTLLRLIMGIDSYEGSLTIGGHEVHDMKLSDLRGLSAYVPQECPLFDGTILENIRLGDIDATDEQVYEAALAADVDTFVKEMEHGYQTQVGENGVKLSGGQRQRIAIARAMLKNAPILLLDEVTASLDSAAEQRIKGALDRLMKGRTTIIVAHRLSTINSADNIMFMDNGQVIESGTHQQLVDRSGQYAHLYNLQASINDSI
jgi:ATP-binding cassette, subfamily B, bacterial